MGCWKRGRNERLSSAARDQPPQAAVMRHKRNVVRRQRGSHAHGARARSADVSCALLRFDGANLGGKSRAPACSRTVRASTHARFTCWLRRSGCGVSSAPVERRPRKKVRGRCLASRTISHRCHGPSATSEAARNRLCLDCVTECRKSAAHTSGKMPPVVHIVCKARNCCAYCEENPARIRKCSPQGGADGLVLHSR